MTFVYLLMFIIIMFEIPMRNICHPQYDVMLIALNLYKDMDVFE